MANIFYTYFISFHSIKFKEDCQFKKCEKRVAISYFELYDLNKEVQIYRHRNNGSSKISNPHEYEIMVFDYDKFFTSIYKATNGKRCDVVMHTTENQEYFILNELKDRENSKSKSRREIREGAQNQLEASLGKILEVPALANFVAQFRKKICISSNAKPLSTIETPAIISGVLDAFNTGRNLPLGKGKKLQMENTVINGLGFEYWDIFGDEVYELI